MSDKCLKQTTSAWRNDIIYKIRTHYRTCGKRSTLEKLMKEDKTYNNTATENEMPGEMMDEYQMRLRAVRSKANELSGNLVCFLHDPRENREAMKDIVEDPSAVYGFSPNPKSVRLGPYAAYCWSDPAFVAWAKEDRRQYHESINDMTQMLFEMKKNNATIEEMARMACTQRNLIRLKAFETDPIGLAMAKESNLKTYGHEEGPDPDQLLLKYGSWAMVLQKAFCLNMGMDVCCNLYDEYYPLYIEIGLISSEVK